MTDIRIRKVYSQSIETVLIVVLLLIVFLTKSLILHHLTLFSLICNKLSALVRHYFQSRNKISI